MNTETPQVATNAIKAGATRRRRHAAGRYPTRHQKLAFAKLMSEGKKALSAEECALLGTHPQLLPSQRDMYSNMAIAMGW